MNRVVKKGDNEIRKNKLDDKLRQSERRKLRENE